MKPRLKTVFSRLWIAFLLLTFVLGPLGGPAAAAKAPPQVLNAPGDHLVTNFSFSLDNPNILRTNQDLTINFSYSTTEPSGVRIFVRPYSDGLPSPSYSAHGSGIYPTSATGTGSGFFTITTGTVVVDEVRVTMYNAAQTELLFEAYLPVYYLFSDAAHMVHSLSYDPDSPNVLPLNQNASFGFGYITRQTGGVRIWIRPFSGGALTPSYAAHGSPVYPISGGSGSGSFTITSGQAVVDQLRIQMWDSTGSTTLLFEAFLPVYYRFKESSNLVSNIQITTDTPNVFKYGVNVNFSFSYNTTDKDGVRIWVRPFSGAALSPDYAAHGSGIYPVGSGVGTGSFTLNSGPTSVDKIRIQMWNPSQTQLLFEAFLPVYLLWAGAGPPPGPDLHVDALEVTQAIQDLNNSVDLVAGKRTYVRVHAAAPVNVTQVYATLKGKRGTINLAPLLTPGNPGGNITVRASPNRGQINDSFWFELPAGWTTAGSLTLTARIDPNNAKNDLDLADNTRAVTVNFLDTPPLRLKLLNVQYTVGANTYLESSNHLDALESWLRRAYPISNLQVSRQTFVYPSAGLPNVDTLHGWLALGKILNMIFSGEDPRIVYYGVVDDGGGFMRGKALSIPGTIAAGPSGSDDWGWDFDGSYNDWYGGHEIGHTRGRYHAEFCGAGGGAAYPYSGGRISPALTGNTAIYGFDITTRAIYPPSWTDVMTYCSNEWVSDFTYEGIRSYLVGTGGPALASPRTAAASQFLAVMGMADLSTNSASLESVMLINQENTLVLPEPGTWELALVDGGGNDLIVYPFAPDELTDAEESVGTPAIIAEVVPWTPGTEKVEIRYQGAVIAERTVSANAPTAALTAPAAGAVVPPGVFNAAWSGSDLDGDTLTYSLLISADNGVTWETLATELSASGLDLDTALLPGGAVLLRLVASDGFLSAVDTRALTLPLHAPNALIAAPGQDAVFFPTQEVSLQGSAYDLEDGSLGDAALSWSSDIDGFLGTGATLSTSLLSTGSHVITLTATDSDGQSGTAEVKLTVADEDFVEPVNLNVAPFAVGVVAAFHGAPSDVDVSLISSGSTEVNWTATPNVPWLSVVSNNGVTPVDMALTVTPGSLAVGTHIGTVTFTSPDAANSPVVLTVNLQITGERTMLPLIVK